MRLEDVINDPDTDEDTKVLAMIDQGYCYMKQSEQGGGNRSSMPLNCTVQTSTLDRYMETREELLNRLSFNKGRENAKEEKQTILSYTPQVPSLKQNYPNPFNPATTIDYELQKTGVISLKVYDTMGRLIKTILDEKKEAGYYSVTWNGKDESAKEVPSGIYYYCLSGKKFSETKQMILLK